MRSTASRSQVHGAPDARPVDAGRPPRDALPRRRHGLEPCRHGSGHRRRRARRGSRFPTSAPASSWVRAAPPPARSSRLAEKTIEIRLQQEGLAPFAVPKAMSSTASATLATWFKIKGVNYSISSACATSNDCVGNAYEMIQYGKQEMMFAGGCEDFLDWTLSVLFRRDGRDVLQVQRAGRRLPRAPMTRTAMASSFRAAPAFWFSKSWNMPSARVAPRYLRRTRRLRAVTSDGADMVAPSGEGAARCMRMAIANVKGPVQQLHQPARDLDARGRSQGNRGHPRSLRLGQRAPADLGDQIADGPFAGRHRRARVDLFAS